MLYRKIKNVFYSESSDSQEACAVGFDVGRLPGIFQTCIHRQGISLPNPLFFFFFDSRRLSLPTSQTTPHQLLWFASNPLFLFLSS